MSAFVHHLAYDFRTGIRDRSKLLMFYLFPFVFFFVVGAFMVQINPGFRAVMIPGMVLFAHMSSVLLSLPSALVQAREAGVFRSYRINGVPSGSIMAIPVIGALVHMAIVTLVIAVAGARLYGGAAPASIGRCVHRGDDGASPSSTDWVHGSRRAESRKAARSRNRGPSGPATTTWRKLVRAIGA